MTAADLANTSISLRDVQAVLLSMFSADTVLIGHSLESDLLALKVLPAPGRARQGSGRVAGAVLGPGRSARWGVAAGRSCGAPSCPGPRGVCPAACPQVIHSTVVDTSVLFPHRLGLPYKRSLRNLMADYLRQIIQDNGEPAGGWGKGRAGGRPP